MELSIAPVFLDAGQRMAAKEAAAIGGYAKHLREGHPEQFEKRASDFYARHAEHVAQAFEPGLTALRSQVADAVRAEFRDGHHVRMVGGGDFQLSDDAAAGAYAKKLGDAHVAAGKAALTALMTGMREPNAVADAIEARCQGLASAIAEGMPHQVRQASNYFARAAYRAAGCTQLRWVADPACTEECRALDGQVVAIDQPFASDPPRHHPPLKEGCRCQVSGVREEKGAARQAPSFRPAVERRDAADGGRWITINGAAVHINAEGMIDKGPKLLVNKHHQDLKATIGEDPHGDLRDQAVDKFAAFLARDKELPANLKVQYQAAADRVIAGMGPEALAEWHNTTVTTHFYGSIKALDDQARAIEGPDKPPGVAAGLTTAQWNQEKERFEATHHINGGSEQPKTNPKAREAADYYAHEFAHSVDLNRNFSHKPEWQEAWKAEEGRVTATMPGRENRGPSEGFSDFAVHAWLYPESAKRDTPRCWSLWHDWKLA